MCPEFWVHINHKSILGFLLCGLIQDNAADSFIFYSDILIKNKKER